MKKLFSTILLLSFFLLSSQSKITEAGYQESVSRCYLLSESFTKTYRKNIDSFDPIRMTVRCVYKNGTTQDFGYKDLEFFSNGVKISRGYKFKVAERKNLTIRLGNYDIDRTIYVTPTFTRDVERYELVARPTKRIYEVGDKFNTSLYSVKCHFSDGTLQEYSGNQLDITVNGKQVTGNYTFVKPGIKKVVVRLGGLKREFNIRVI